MCGLRRYTLLLCFTTVVVSEKSAKLVNNGYEGVVVAIDHNVPEDDALIDAIKTMMTDASSAMFQATRSRAYFKAIVILVPKTWTKGNYLYANNETFEFADIRVAPPHPDLRHNPYARSYSKCGKEGQYIHLTPDYITKDSVSDGYGPRGKVVVHEWGHYRWGLKDEYPTGRTEEEKHENSFYLDLSGKVEATRCSLGITGVLKTRDFTDCQQDTSSFLPNLGCIFRRYAQQESNLETSLMYAGFINEVTMFCHDDPSDEMNMHNKDAPNNQNRQCNHRSTWDVVMESVDFQRGSINEPSSSITDTTPRFSVVKHQSKRIVLVMDTSGSMAGEKIRSQRSACELFLTSSIGDGSFIGLVKFESDATILEYLTEVRHGDGSRENLANALPEDADGGTAIGRGIQKAIAVLEASGQGAGGGQMVVLTDGQENVAPYVNDVADDVLSKGIVLNAVFFGLVDVDDGQPLAVLSQRSGGKWYFASDAAKSRSELNNIFSTLARPSDGDFSSTAVQITSRVVESEAGVTIRYTVAIDSSVGNRTVFIFTWMNSEPEIELKPPSSNCLYSNAVKENKIYCSIISVTDISLQTIKFTVPGQAEIGQWEYAITSTVSDSTVVTVTSATSTDGVYPITVEPELQITNVSGNEVAVVIAKVFKNEVPVLGATVTATINRPVDEDVTLELKDNGAGADEIIDDGVYSRYFTNFSAQGRYAIQVTVLKSGSAPAGIASVPGAMGNPGEVLPDGTFVPNPNYVEPLSEVSGAKIEGDLERVASSPGIAYTGLITDADIFPPNKITDLLVTQVDLNNATAGVLLRFTAPGDDYDSGTASRYDVRLTNESSSVLLSEFDHQLPVKTTNESDLQRPKPALATEEVNVFLPETTQWFEKKSLRLSFAIRTFDEVDNPSEVSNIGFMTFFVEAPSRPTSPPKDNTGIIVGAVVGGVVLIVIVLIVIFKCVILKRPKC